MTGHCLCCSPVCRFTHAPRLSHAKALKRIVHYIQGTKDKGLIFAPTNELVVDCYVDADFAGLWKSEDDQRPRLCQISHWICFRVRWMSSVMDKQATDGNCSVNKGVSVDCSLSSNAGTDSSLPCRQRSCNIYLPWRSGIN